MLGLDAAELGVNVHEVRAGGVVDEQRRFGELHRGHLQHAALVLIQIAEPELLLVHVRLGADQTREQLLVRHFEREDRDRPGIFFARGNALRDVERERGLAHGRAGRDDDQLAGMEAAGHLVDLVEPAGEAADAPAGIEKRADAAVELLDDVAGPEQLVLALGVAQFEERFFGVAQDDVRVFLIEHGPLDDRLRADDDPAEERLLLDDAGVAFEVVNLRQPVVERDQVRDAVHRFEVPAPHQLVRHRHAVDAFALLVERQHGVENAFVLFEAEVVGLENGANDDERRVVEHDGAQYQLFGVGVGWQPSLEGNVARGHRSKVTVLGLAWQEQNPR